MSLGVLNNINAIYAENNLNNTSNSLSKVLNQLSSGSKINSGADDAAGLSLVNGLAANPSTSERPAASSEPELIFDPEDNCCSTLDRLLLVLFRLFVA